MRMKKGISCHLTLLHHAIWASALQIGSMKIATSRDLDDITHMNTYLDEDDFESEFGLEQIDDPREKALRSEALKENEEIIRRENVAYVNGEKTWYDKMYEFDDLTKDEFLKEKTGLHIEYGRGLVPAPDGPEGRDARSEKYFDKFRYSRARIPSSYSSVKEGNVSPVKNQRICGSCVSFATIASIETCFKKVTGVFGDYSEQELVDCGYNDVDAWGCQGAMYFSYAKWVVENERELAHESNYPYLNTDPKLTCPRNLRPYNQGARVTDYFYTQDGNETLLKNLVYEHGAVIVSVNADDIFKNYGGGILSQCSRNGLYSTNHAVAVVGYGTERGIDYWLIKNSWGPKWGKGGYIRLKRGSNACGIGWVMATVSCERVPGPTDRPLSTKEPCWDNWPECKEYAKTNCKGYGKNCRYSCGLCKGMTPHKSNTCWDMYKRCPKYAKDGRCSIPSYKKNCCISCKSASPPPCFDEWGQHCVTRRDEFCPYPEHAKFCKKTCGGCEQSPDPAPGPACIDTWGHACRTRKKEFCPVPQYAKYCKKTCGGC